MKHYAKNFTDQEIHLDGQHFEDCNMLRCKLVYSGRAGVTMIGCDLDGVTIQFDGPAGNTLSIIKMMIESDAFRPMIEETLDIFISEPEPEETQGWLSKLLPGSWFKG